MLRLEIEALRKDLQLTKERVQTLEGQVNKERVKFPQVANVGDQRARSA